MTPEELNRTMEFIIESQARLAAAQEQDREQRTESEIWSKSLISQLASGQQRILELIEIESRRLDRQDERLRQYESEQRHAQEAAQQRHDESQKRNEEFQRDTLALLHRVLDKLIGNIDAKT
jgi:hypothetical protein